VADQVKKVAEQQLFSAKEGEKRGTALFVSEAETYTGITQQQVSKWHRRLKESEKYREMLCGAAHANAMVETGNSSNDHFFSVRTFNTTATGFRYRKCN